MREINEEADVDWGPREAFPEETWLGLTTEK